MMMRGDLEGPQGTLEDAELCAQEACYARILMTQFRMHRMDVEWESVCPVCSLQSCDRAVRARVSH
jgi:hypothetical protein